MKESPLLVEFGYLVKHRLDIQDLVDRSRNLVLIAHPLVQLIKFIKMLLCWEHKLATLSLFITFNVVGALISEIGLLMLLVTFSTSVISLGFCHYRYHMFKKVVPTLDLDADYNLKSHPENMRDFRILLALLEKFVIQSTNLILKLYSFIKWEDLYFTIKFHVLFFVSFLILTLFPMRFFLLFLLDISLLLHPLKQIYNEPFVKSCPSPVKDFSESSTAYSNPPEKSEPNTSELITETSDNQGDGSLATDSDCSEKLADDTDDDAPQDILSNPFLVQSQQTLPNNNPTTTTQFEQPVTSTTTVFNNNLPFSNKNVPNQKPPNLVERLLELKKRAKNLEKCSSCGVVFTAILKRRHICSSCGNHYCARCCSHKVPRSKFGATAPAAQTETVAVCTPCLHKLVKQEKKID